MARKRRIRNHASIVKYHPDDPYAQSKTEVQWRKEGRIVTGPGELMNTNSNGWVRVRYYKPDETREATAEEVAAWKAEQKALKAARQRERELEAQRQAEYEKAHAEAKERRLNELATIDPSKIICLDTETTGVTYSDEILQLSIINGRGDVLFNEFIRPMQHTSWTEAEAVNGISPEMVHDKPTIQDFVSQIKGILNHADLIVGYNLDFDMGFIRRAGINVPRGIHYYDVMTEFAEIYGEWNEYYQDYKWQKLCVCADYYGYQGSNFHDALEDVRATLFCFNAMIKMTI